MCKYEYIRMNLSTELLIVNLQTSIIIKNYMTLQNILHMENHQSNTGHM